VPEPGPTAKENSVPHLKCSRCRARCYVPGDRAGPIEDLCPGCGSPFEPVGDLSELVGFRAITARDAPQRGLVQRLGLLVERRTREQARYARRWEHDDDGALAASIALPRPETTC
jgi:hypothetical protein